LIRSGIGSLASNDGHQNTIMPNKTKETTDKQRIAELELKLKQQVTLTTQLQKIVADKMGEGKLTRAADGKSYDFIGTILPPIDWDESAPSGFPTSGDVPTKVMWITARASRDAHGGIKSLDIKSWFDTRS